MVELDYEISELGPGGASRRDGSVLTTTKLVYDKMKPTRWPEASIAACSFRPMIWKPANTFIAFSVQVHLERTCFFVDQDESYLRLKTLTNGNRATTIGRRQKVLEH